MKYLSFAPAALFAALVALSACPQGTAPNLKDAGVIVLDGGFTGEGEGEGAGEGEGTAGEGEGEGSFQLCDGGLCGDAGSIQGTPYSGSPEPGTRCDVGAPDETTCAVGIDCCATASQQGFTASCGTAGQACPTPGFLNGSIVCDGKEDCADGEECCFDQSDFSNLTTTCVPAGTCESGQNKTTVCVTNDDCVAGQELCCSPLIPLPTDFGVCQPAANNCAFQP